MPAIKNRIAHLGVKPLNLSKKLQTRNVEKVLSTNKFISYRGANLAEGNLISKKKFSSHKGNGK